MNARRSLPSALAFGLALVCASALSSARANADEPKASEQAVATPPPTLVLVHIDSPKPVRLEARATDQAWAFVCDAPCDRELPLADEYRVGDGPTFRLAPTGGFVLLQVRPAAAGNAGGSVLVWVGVISAAVGAVGVAVGVAYASQSTPQCGPGSNDWCGFGPTKKELGTDLALVSLVPLLGGVGLIAWGEFLLAGKKTSVTQLPSSGREPTWVGPQSSTFKRGLVVPLSFAF